MKHDDAALSYVMKEYLARPDRLYSLGLGEYNRFGTEGVVVGVSIKLGGRQAPPLIQERGRDLTCERQGVPMIKTRFLIVIAISFSFFVATNGSTAQDRAMSSAPAFSGGVFVTPVSGLRFPQKLSKTWHKCSRTGASFIARPLP